MKDGLELLLHVVKSTARKSVRSSYSVLLSMGWRSRGRAETRGLSALSSGNWDAGSQNEVGRQAPSSCPHGQGTFLLFQVWASPWVWIGALNIYGEMDFLQETG